MIFIDEIFQKFRLQTISFLSAFLQKTAVTNWSIVRSSFRSFDGIFYSLCGVPKNHKFNTSILRFATYTTYVLQCATMYLIAKSIRNRNSTQNTVPRVVKAFNAIQWASMRFNVLQWASMRFNVLQYTSMGFNALQCTSISFNILQCASMYFNALQCIWLQNPSESKIPRKTLCLGLLKLSMRFNALQCTSMRFNAFQCASMYFNALQCTSMRFNVLQCALIYLIANVVGSCKFSFFNACSFLLVPPPFSFDGIFCSLFGVPKNHKFNTSILRFV
jgi:hypothetical protein